MNDLMSFGLHRLWKQKIIAMLKVNKNSIVLDLASGSGDITRKIKEQYDCMCISIDANMEMIDIAKKKTQEDSFNFIKGTAEYLPFRSLSFDYVIVSFGLRNFSNIPKSLKQIHRVLKKDGKFICLEFSEVNNAIFKKNVNSYFKIIPKLGLLFAKNQFAYDYLIESIKKFPNQVELSKKIRKAGFKETKVIDIIDGIAAIHISEK